ncbi:UNVERIFIED_CONTAM: hypothetical protein N8J90_11795 [Halobacillus marinus]
MKVKNYMAVLFLGMAVTMAACSSNAETTDEDDPSATEQSQETDVKDKTNASDEANEETDKETASSSEAEKTAEGEDTRPFTKKSFDTERQAAAYIEDYRKVEQTNMELGHGIKASRDAGAGHEHILWNEGNWLIETDFPLDDQYANADYPDNEKLAADIVDYLEDHYLPAPEDRGVIKINGFADSKQTLIQWQDGKVVYEKKSKEAHPLDLIKQAVEEGKG